MYPINGMNKWIPVWVYRTYVRYRIPVLRIHNYWILIQIQIFDDQKFRNSPLKNNLKSEFF
jgi:hypothetical protein